MQVATIVLVSTCALLCSACADDAEPSTGASSTRTSGAAVQTGVVEHWAESSEHLTIDLDSQPARVVLGAARPSGLDAFWSVASTAGAGTGFFYADGFRASGETQVAHLPSVHRVQDVHDAGAVDYSHAAVGPVAPGEVVLVHHIPSGRYLALVIDTIVQAPGDARTLGAGPYAFATMTWYLTAAGSADFSAAP